jgi:hypothetical protein
MAAGTDTRPHQQASGMACRMFHLKLAAQCCWIWHHGAVQGDKSWSISAGGSAETLEVRWSTRSGQALCGEVNCYRAEVLDCTEVCIPSMTVPLLRYDSIMIYRYSNQGRDH